MRHMRAQLDKRVGIGVHRDRHSLTARADVEVGARRVYALVANTHDLLLANIAARVVAEASLRRLASDNIFALVYLDERMTWVNLV